MIRIAARRTVTPPPAQPAQAAAVLLLGLACLLADRAHLYHTDVWAHLAVGRWIVAHGRLPAHEPLSPAADRAAGYYNHCWLSQVAMHGACRAGERLAGGDWVRRTEGGVELLRAGFAALYVLRLLMLLVALERRSGSPAIAGLGLALRLAAGAGYVVVARPQVVGECGFAFVLMALSRPVPSRRAVIAVPLACAAWANLHGSYVLGLGLQAVFLAGRAIEVLQEDGRWDWGRVGADPRVQRLLVMLPASALATLLNPRGPWIYAETLRMASHPNLATLSEWRPMDLSPRGWWPCYAALTVLLGATRRFSRRRFTATEALLLVFAVLPLVQQRWMTWWLLAAPWIMAPHWAAIAARAGLPRGIDFDRRSGWWTALAALLATGLAAFSTPVQWVVRGRPEPLDRAVSQGTPWRLAATLREPSGPPSERLEALEWALRDHYLDGRFVGSILPGPEAGDFLVWALGNEVPVLAYLHPHVFTRSYWDRYGLVLGGVGTWRDFLDAHRVNLVVVAAEGGGLAAAIREDPAWLVVLDEAGSRARRRPTDRLLAALRTHPLGPSSVDKSEGRPHNERPLGTTPRGDR
jgi:hypothetical protein